MNESQRPSAPIFPSSLSANLKAEESLRRSRNDVVDSEGLNWKLTWKTSEEPDSLNSKRLLWKAMLTWKASASVEDLLGCDTLCSESDDRIIEKLASLSSVQFSLPAIEVSADSEIELSKKTKAALVKSQHLLASSKIRAYKRRVIIAIIEKSCEFS